MCQDDLFPCFDEWVSPSVISRLRGDIRLQYDRSRVRFPQLGRAGIGSRDGRCCVGHVTVDAYQSSWQVPRAQGRAWLAGLPSWPLRVGGGPGARASKARPLALAEGTFRPSSPTPRAQGCTGCSAEAVMRARMAVTVPAEYRRGDTLSEERQLPTTRFDPVTLTGVTC